VLTQLTCTQVNGILLGADGKCSSCNPSIQSLTCPTPLQTTSRNPSRRANLVISSVASKGRRPVLIYSLVVSSQSLEHISKVGLPLSAARIARN
jgi:hypothetical protein